MKKKKGRGYKIFWGWNLDPVDKEGIYEKVSFECRCEGNGKANLTGFWGKSISGRGNSNDRGAVGGSGLACLHKDSASGTLWLRGWGASEKFWGRGFTDSVGPHRSEFTDFDYLSCPKQVSVGRWGGASLEHTRMRLFSFQLTFIKYQPHGMHCAILWRPKEEREIYFPQVIQSSREDRKV